MADIVSSRHNFIQNRPSGFPIPGVPVWLILCLCISLFFPGCEPKQDPFIIGAVFDLTGKGAEDSRELRQGMELAISEVNKWGGINGQPIKLEVRDSRGDHHTAGAMFEELARKSSPDLMVTHYSATSMALAPLAEKFNLPMVSCITSTPELTRQNRWCFRFYTSAWEDVAPALAVLNQMHVTHLGVIYLDDPFGRELSGFFRTAYRESNKTLTEAAFETATRDFADHVRAVMDTEAVYIVGLTSHLKSILRAIRAAGYQGRVLGPAHMGNTGIRTMPEAAGVYVSAPTIYNPRYAAAGKLKQRFRERFQADFDLFAANGYDLIKLLAGLMENQSTDPETIRSCLAGGFSYSGVTGQINTRKGERDIIFSLKPAQILPDGSIRFRNQ
ncbi:MAG: ABC transporter substrate-binding protein [Desulfobacterales bacterium]|nr:ABC transporter substrate-binding protein [Desulfobacterales bacterium]